MPEPNNDSPLNGQAASLWADQATFRQHLLKHYAEHGGKP
jgi:hypothetical protein